MEDKISQELCTISAKIAALDEKIKAAFVRIDEQKQLVETVHKFALSIESTTYEQRQLRADVDEIRTRSTKRWDTVLIELIKLAVAVGAGAVLTKIGLGG